MGKKKLILTHNTQKSSDISSTELLIKKPSDNTFSTKYCWVVFKVLKFKFMRFCYHPKCSLNTSLKKAFIILIILMHIRKIKYMNKLKTLIDWMMDSNVVWFCCETVVLTTASPCWSDIKSIRVKVLINFLTKFTALIFKWQM